MATRTGRLEIRLPDATRRLLREEARRRRVPVSELVRQGIELVIREDRAARLKAAATLFAVGAPVADWETMEDEIERAHGADNR